MSSGASGGSATRGQRRAARRRVGEREIDRRARGLVVRIVELHEAGHSPAAIASSTGLAEEVIRRVLKLEEES